MRSGVRFHQAVRVRLGPERGFLFDERTGRVYSLNATAALAAAHLEAKATEAEVVRRVVAAFDIDPEGRHLYLSLNAAISSPLRTSRLTDSGPRRALIDMVDPPELALP